MKTYHQLSGQMVTINIPDTHSSLLIKRDNLKIEKLALKTRITNGVTGTQRFHINAELARINTELAMINAKIANFSPIGKEVEGKKKTTQLPGDSLRRKISDRQKQLEAKGLEPFPENATAQEKYDWALSMLNSSVGLLNGCNRTSLEETELIKLLGAGFSVAVNVEKVAEAEANLAKSIYNKAS